MGPDQGTDMAEDTKNFSAWMRAADIQASVSRCADLFNCGVFNSNNTAGPLFESAVTLLLVHLNDLLQKAKQDGKRIDFSDDMEATDVVADITDLVRTCRNAACHVTSGEHKIDSNKFTFCVTSGYGPGAFVINGQEMGCDHEDDMAIYYGKNRIYLRRHLLRSFELVAQMYRSDGRW
ncbi:hypothetical protein GTQ41_17065 [Pseudomonas sp. AN-B15]|nr:hypothetical protein GTQ41_05540 [Pseudomonas sp. AN-B15]QXE10697.1 hypothetical protein GTQ41_17065 [Pseudomonas sp. AN-B15]